MSTNGFPLVALSGLSKRRTVIISCSEAVLVRRDFFDELSDILLSELNPRKDDVVRQAGNRAITSLHLIQWEGRFKWPQLVELFPRCSCTGCICRLPFRRIRPPWPHDDTRHGKDASRWFLVGKRGDGKEKIPSSISETSISRNLADANDVN